MGSVVTLTVSESPADVRLSIVSKSTIGNTISGKSYGCAALKSQ